MTTASLPSLTLFLDLKRKTVTETATRITPAPTHAAMMIIDVLEPDDVTVALSVVMSVRPPLVVMAVASAVSMFVFVTVLTWPDLEVAMATADAASLVGMAVEPVP